MIEKGKKFNFKSDLCESGEISERKDYANISANKSLVKRYKEGHKDNNVSVFAYLICADKSMADDVANKEKEHKEHKEHYDKKKSLQEESESKSSDKSEDVKIEENDNHLNTVRVKNSIYKKINTNVINNNISSNEKITVKDNIIFSLSKTLGNNITRSQEVGNKGIFKELIKSMNNNLNKQMALIEKDSSSEKSYNYLRISPSSFTLYTSIKSKIFARR